MNSSWPSLRTKALLSLIRSQIDHIDLSTNFKVQLHTSSNSTSSVTVTKHFARHCTTSANFGIDAPLSVPLEYLLRPRAQPPPWRPSRVALARLPPSPRRPGRLGGHLAAPEQFGRTLPFWRWSLMTLSLSPFRWACIDLGRGLALGLLAKRSDLVASLVTGGSLRIRPP